MIKQSIVTDEGKKWALVEASGRLDVEVSKQIIAICDQIERANPHIDIVADCTEIEDMAVGPDDLLEITAFFHKNEERSGRTALVTGPENDRHVLGLMYEILVKDFERRLVRVFHTRKEAKHWMEME